MMGFDRLPASATLDDLTPQQAAFVTAFIELGGRPGCAAEAALAAGYGNGVEEKAARQARTLLKSTRIISAIRAEMEKVFGAAAVLGLSTLKALCEDAPPSVRLSAAKELLDRGYGPVPSKSSVVQATMTIEDIIRSLDAQERSVIDVTPSPRENGDD